MGSALARAAQKGAPEGTALYLANRTPEKAQALCRELPGARAASNEEIARACDLISWG